MVELKDARLNRRYDLFSWLSASCMTISFPLLYFIYAHIANLGLYLFALATIVSLGSWLGFTALALQMIGQRAISLPSSQVMFYATIVVAGCLIIIIIVSAMSETPGDQVISHWLTVISLSVVTIFAGVGLYMAKLNYDATQRLPLAISLTTIQLVVGIFLTIIVLYHGTVIKKLNEVTSASA